MTPEKWDNFIENAGAKAKSLIESYQNSKFSSLICAAFPWDLTGEGVRYWLKISSRTEPIV